MRRALARDFGRRWLRATGLAWMTAGCAAPPPPCPCTAQSPPPAPTCPSVTVAPSAPSSCGQLALREARLVAAGKGDKHPELMEVRARLSQCADRTPTAAECAGVRSEGEELAKKYGPEHPARRIHDAERALCPPPSPPPPPPTLLEPVCGAGSVACGSGPHGVCCGKGQKCCSGGAAGSYYCNKQGPGPCPPLP